MNIEQPHDMISMEALRKLPKDAQAKYIPIPLKDERMVMGASVEQRAAWLKARMVGDGFDVARSLKAEVKRARKERKA